jgi:hypothetical protein
MLSIEGDDGCSRQNMYTPRTVVEALLHINKIKSYGRQYMTLTLPGDQRVKFACIFKSSRIKNTYQYDIISKHQT